MKVDRQVKQRKSIFILSRKTMLIVSAILIFVAVLGVTTAYLIDKTDEIKNRFSPANVDSEVVENVKDDVKSSVKIQNTGNTDAYIRVAVIANSVNEAGDILGAADASAALANTGWITDGKYYYWTQAVSPQGFTGELLKEGGIALEGKQVTILAEAIQAKGVENAVAESQTERRHPVTIAWGMNVKADGTLELPPAED